MGIANIEEKLKIEKELYWSWPQNLKISLLKSKRVYFLSKDTT